MKRLSRLWVALTLLALVTGILVAACNAKTEAPASTDTLDGKALAGERCSVCHGYDRVENAEKTAEEWKTTVERMVAKGAKLDAAEQTAVIEHLSQ